MTSWQKVVGVGIVAITGLLVIGLGTHASAQPTAAPQVDSPIESPAVVTSVPDQDATNPGLDDLYESLRVKIVSGGMRDLNKVIELLEVAIDKGLDDDNLQFAEDLLSNSLMERATSLIRVINMRSIHEKGVQKIRHLVTSDLRGVLDYDDPPVIAHLMLAKLMALPGGDPREARRAINAFLASDDLPATQRAEAIILRGRLRKDPARALADFDEAIELEPENNGLRIARAILLRGQNRLGDALAAIDEILEKNPDVANALLLQGELLRQLHRLDEALASFDQATQLAPNAPGPYQSRGEIYREQGDFDNAVKQFSKVLELQPNALSTLVQRAEAYLFNDKLDEALADVEVVLEREQQVPAIYRIATYRVRGEILSKMGRLDDAIEQMELVTEAMPDSIDLKMQLARYYLEDKRPRRAIVAYGDVITADANNFFALRARGDAYLSIGMHVQAVADFERALSLQPEDTALLNNLAWVLATSPAEEVRDGVRALKLATKACELTEYKTPHILSTLAAAYAESGNFETAIKWSQQAVDLSEQEQMVADLTKELSSYLEGQPWREKQSLTDQKKAQEEASTQPPATSQTSPEVRP